MKLYCKLNSIIENKFFMTDYIQKFKEITVK